MHFGYRTTAFSHRRHRGWAVKSCECLRSCTRHPLSVEYRAGWPCVEVGGIPPEQQLSDLPDESVPNVIYYRNFLDAESNITREVRC